MLSGGGELLVRGAVSLAYRFHISTLVVGMTVVSFGTSAPELVVSLMATTGGSPDIAVGNVVGSNIANIALVLGLTAMFFPLVVDRNSARIDWPVMMGATLLFYGLVVSDQKLVRWEGILFVALLLIFLVWLITKSRKETKAKVQEEERPYASAQRQLLDIGLIIAGCIGLVIGADLLVKGAVEIATVFGVSERIIGVTVVAIGTSLPELATSIVAAFRKQTNLLVGNLIGSNLFNIFAILGITSIVNEIPINDEVLSFDIWWVIGISAALLPLMLLGRKINRLKGALLFGTYILYIYFLF